VRTKYLYELVVIDNRKLWELPGRYVKGAPEPGKDDPPDRSPQVPPSSLFGIGNNRYLSGFNMPPESCRRGAAASGGATHRVTQVILLAETRRIQGVCWPALAPLHTVPRYVQRQPGAQSSCLLPVVPVLTLLYFPGLYRCQQRENKGFAPVGGRLPYRGRVQTAVEPGPLVLY
jgi:hypothetical protein